MLKLYIESAVGDQWENAYNDYDEVDGTLVRYTLNPTTPIIGIFEDALYRYSNDKPITIYRGLNFSSKEGYEEFMQSITNGRLKIERCSSWSPSKSTAEIFAMTRPCYMEFMGFGSMTLVSQQEKESERIAGYRGVILKTRISAHKGIDLRKTSFAKEDEILLGPGTYRVEVSDVLSYKDTLENTNIDDMIYSLRNKEEELQKFLSYVKKHYTPNDISEESKELIFKAFVSPNQIGKYETHYYKRENQIYAVFIAVYPSEWYPDNRNSLIINKGKKTFKSFIDKVFDLYADHDYTPKIEWECDVNRIANIYGMSNYLQDKMNIVGQQYKKCNDTVKDINKIKDPKERQQAIDDYKNDIVRLLKNMGVK